MDKIKASDLLSKMIYNMQTAFIEEDERLKSTIFNEMEEKNIDPNQYVTVKQLPLFFRIKDENYRMVLIRTIIATLSDYNIIENDIDLKNDELIAKYLNKNTTRAVIDRQGDNIQD